MKPTRFIARKTFGSGEKSFSGFIIQLTAVAVALSVAVMIVAICIIKGFRTEISQKVFGLWGHVHITHINAQRFEEVPFPDTAEWIRDLNKLSSNGFEWEGKSYSPPIQHMQAFAHFPAILKGEDAFEGLIVKGVDSSFYWDHFQLYLDSLDQGADNIRDKWQRRSLMISRTTAHRLDLHLEDEVILYFIKGGKQVPRKFEISHIYHSGISEFDQKLAFIQLDALKNVMGWKEGEIGGLELFVTSLDDLEQIADYVYFDVVPADFVARSIKSKLYSIFQWLELQKVNEAIILGLMIIICVLNMATGVLILLFERSQLIGLLTTLGFSMLQLQKIFLYYAYYILSRGLLWGNGIALSLCAIQYFFHPLTLDESSYYLAYAPIEFDWLKILAVNIGTALIILIAMFLPVQFIRKIDPVRVLRFR